MKILVCITHVPDTTSRIAFTENDTKFDKNGVQFIIGPYDDYALARAVELKESNGASITVLNVGEAETEPTLRKALAIGADEAVRVNMNVTDSFSTATEIANYIKQNSFDLIIAGRESTDYNGGAVSGMIAEMLDLPFVNACIGFEVEGESAKLIREIDGGKEMISSTSFGLGVKDCFSVKKAMTGVTILSE